MIGSTTRRSLSVLVGAALAAAFAAVCAWGQTALPPLPGGEDGPLLPPLPGSAEVGRNPLNAAHLDTLLAVEGLLAGGMGVAAGFERALTNILCVEAEVGWLGASGAASGTPWRLGLASALAGIRTSLMQTAVNGPSIGLAAGVAAVGFRWGTESLRYAWPQLRLDAAMKLSLGRGSRGLFVEPRAGYKLVFAGAETQGVPIPRYGGLSAGLRIGLSF